MKVLFLSDGSSVHTIRWVNGLASRGLKVFLVSVQPISDAVEHRVTAHKLRFNSPLGYILNTLELRSLIRKYNPDIINAHFASGYGVLAALANSSPLLMSIWGSDITSFPSKSFIHRSVIKYNFHRSDAFAVTSKFLRSKLDDFQVKGDCFLTPFGIDINKFIPLPSRLDKNSTVIGTIKTLEDTYGIDILIKAFALAWEMLGKPDNLYLHIGGEGPQKENLLRLAKELHVDSRVKFLGAIPHQQVPDMLQEIDIFMALSRRESFGVSVLEAAACAKPVIVSDAEGLVEITSDGINGFIVPRGNSLEAAKAIIKLVENKTLRSLMGMEGRKMVVDNYSWEKSLDNMICAYRTTCYKKN